MTGTLRQLSGRAVLVCRPQGAALSDDRAATDLVGDALSVGAKLVAIPTERLPPEFLDLSTRLAGEVLQKFVNYGLQVAVVGDVSGAVAASKALADFVRESNRGRHIWFVEDLAALEAKLAADTRRDA